MGLRLAQPGTPSSAARLESPRLVGGAAAAMAFHEHPFAFQAGALRGLRIFLTTPADAGEGAASGVGNCVACHAPPEFTDHGWHDTGISQVEYDAVHGDGAFAELSVPALAARNESPAAFLPATPSRPDGTGRFASIPASGSPELADLGLWNVLFDDGRPRPQSELQRVFRRQIGGTPADEELLQRAVAAFKTPRLRDVGQPGPYMHDGSLDTFGEVVRFYLTTSDLARQGRLRDGDAEIAAIRLADDDVRFLAAFLRSLDQDYD